MIDLTMASNCYEKNYILVTNEEWAKQLFLFGNENIQKRVLFVSNITSREKIKERSERLIDNGIIDRLLFSYDYFDQVKDTFLGCDRNTFIRKPSLRERLHAIAQGNKLRNEYDGLLYSISQMVAILQCETEYLLYVTEDVKLDTENFIEWVNKSIDRMKEDETIIVTNPVWNNMIEEAREEAFCEDEDFYYSFGFSDQCCLLNIKRILDLPDVFSEKNKITEKVFPFYAGNHFERRISAYMRNHNLYRATYKHSSYTHSDITSNDIAKYK